MAPGSPSDPQAPLKVADSVGNGEVILKAGSGARCLDVAHRVSLITGSGKRPDVPVCASGGSGMHGVRGARYRMPPTGTSGAEPDRSPTAAKRCRVQENGQRRLLKVESDRGEVGPESLDESSVSRSMP